MVSGKINPSPKPRNRLFISPAILGFKNDYEDENYEQTENNSE